MSRTPKRGGAAKAAKATAEVVVRTDGQRLLRALQAAGRSWASIASECGVSRQVVHRWSAGEKAPGPEARATLERLGIPRAAWERPPVSTTTATSAPAAATSPAGARARKATTLEQVDQQIADIDTELADDLLVADRVKLITVKGQLLNTRARIEEQTRQFEASFVTKTAWCRRVVENIARVLLKWPEAAEAVAAELEREGLVDHGSA